MALTDYHKERTFISEARSPAPQDYNGEKWEAAAALSRYTA